MYPFFSGKYPNWHKSEKKVNDHSSGTIRICARFWIFLKREYQGDLIDNDRIDQSAGRIGHISYFSPLEAFFWSKNAKNTTNIRSAGSGRNIKILAGMCALDPEDTFRYLKWYNTCNRSKFMTKNIYHVRHFLKKNCFKIELREIFQL